MRFAPLLVLIAVAGGGCAPLSFGSGAPALARSIRGADSEAPSAAARARFPVGSSETRMLAELKRERFVLGPSEAGRFRTAAASWRDLPCLYTYSLRWRADEQGAIAEISATFTDACT